MATFLVSLILYKSGYWFRCQIFIISHFNLYTILSKLNIVRLFT